MRHTFPRTIKGYVLQEAVGAGTVGTVYRAYQPAIGREVALKAIRAAHANQPEFIRQFEVVAQRIAHLKKAEMATAAEELLAGTGWLPEPLRTPGQSFTLGTAPAASADTDRGGKDPSAGQAAHGPPQAVAAE